jgi:hypothetical protein
MIPCFSRPRHILVRRGKPLLHRVFLQGFF